MVNKYPGACAVCGNMVPKNGGNLIKQGRRFQPVHLACSEGTPQVVSFRFSSGATMTQNSKGRCIDAPCCGCCS